MIFPESLSFDDILLKPQYSEVKSRKDIDLFSIFGEENLNYRLSLPVISAPMSTVTGGKLAESLLSSGALGIIHRYNSIGEQVKELLSVSISSRTNKSPGCAVGVSGDYLERAQELTRNGCKLICIDVAHGHHILVKQAIENIKKIDSNIHVMAGNVVTYEACRYLAEAGADSLKIGIGSSGICSTRIETGHGISQVTALRDCVDIKDKYNVDLVLDGGIKTNGDIAKAIALGADFVMMGSMFAGADETPGSIFEENGQKYKKYVGMASEEAQLSWRGFSSSREGISTKVPYKGPVKNILENIDNSLRSALSYSGARNLREFQAKAKFFKQSLASQYESSTYLKMD